MNKENEAYSMTGFATADGLLGESAGASPRGFSLSVKSVNHRHLDLQIRMPAGLDSLEAALRRTVKARVKRGHVELTLSLEKAGVSASVQLDEALLDAYVRAFRQAAARFHLHADPDLDALLRLPGVMSSAVAALDVAGAEAPLLEAAERALTRLNEVRAQEGAVLVEELRRGMGRVADMAEQARTLREQVSSAAVERLRLRLAEMLGGLSVSDERLLTEAALLVERGDVEEELVRLRTHVDRFLELLDRGGELGKQLDFLLQELNREANTLLSKTGGAAGAPGLRLTDLGLAMKVELERAREQVQNLE